MTFWSFLNHWWNLPSLVMLGSCAAFRLLQAVGLLGAGDDHELDLEAHDALEADAEHDVELDHDVDQDLDADSDQGSLWQEALGFLGAGRVPFKLAPVLRTSRRMRPGWRGMSGIITCSRWIPRASVTARMRSISARVTSFSIVPHSREPSARIRVPRSCSRPSWSSST